MTVGEYILLFSSVVLSGLSFFLLGEIKKQTLKLLLAFSGSYLFGITVLHLIPEVYEGTGSTIGIYILAGFFLQIILETFSEGIEHGHIHVHHDSKNAFPLSLMIGLCLHSLFEGMPLSAGHQHENDFHHSLLGGIILHHIPVAIALMSMFVQSGVKKGNAIFYLIIFALMAPLGALASQTLSDASSLEMALTFKKLMAIVIGIFLHISTTILFESSENHRFNYLKLLIIVAGAALALFSF